MPFFGLELLDLARGVAGFNLPARVGQLFGVSRRSPGIGTAPRGAHSDSPVSVQFFVVGPTRRPTERLQPQDRSEWTQPRPKPPPKRYSGSMAVLE
jgi:hypothetical protein